MKIGELAKRSGLSAHTIRYYEKIGLLPYASRDRSSRRDYDASILSWIAFLRRLKTTGMPIRDMLRYARLREGGGGTDAERRALLETHRDRVRAQVADLQACLLTLDAKIAGYAAPRQASPERTDDDDAPPHERRTPEPRTPEHGTPEQRREPARARPARAR
ncbi:MerR family transcriptional regulator [Methylobacterium terrae]|uniref:MerR family transcriptional regulator n=1 Tax=Methylobacterium terrae TaxID=2202827 RepID=A0A2U8WVL8_9HYPH|nr:MerR family transcriptional regulator [Methylobacterium terrae]AWN49302.1 MerR family transcriptional regulator [Methylobacterium terrae]